MAAIDELALVDEIRDLLVAKGNPLPDEIASLASDYITLCKEANDRLRACSRLLRKGLRTEAIQLAEQEPNLIELVSTLDFPERSQWSDYLRQHNELQPPELLVDIAAELNEAYATELPLSTLLQQHRCAALERSPLSLRIAILRRIAKADPLGAWRDDLAKYEQARMQQIGDEITAAAKAFDVDTLVDIEREVTSNQWLKPVGDPLIQRAKQTHQRIRATKARRELEELAQQLAAAHSEFEADKGRSVRGRWLACVALADLPSDDPLAIVAAPTLAWLDEQDRLDIRQAEFDTTVAQLNTALDSQAPRAELERLAYAVLHYELGIPELTDQRLRERMKALDQMVRRRRVLIVLGTVIVVLSIAILTKNKLEQGVLADHVAQVNRLIDENQLDLASQYIQRLSESEPLIAASKEIKLSDDWIRKLESAREKFNLQLASLTAELQEKINEKQIESGSMADAKKLLKSVKDLAESKEQELKATAGEMATMNGKEVVKIKDSLTESIDHKLKPIYQQIASRDSAKEQAEQDRINSEFERDYKAIETELTRLEESSKTTPPSDEVLSKLNRDLTALSKRDKVTSPLLAVVPSTIARLGDLTRSNSARREQSLLISQVTEQIGQANAFANALGNFANKASNTARSIDFAKVKNEASLWQALEQRNQLLTQWSTLDVKKLSDQAIADLVTQKRSVIDDPLISLLPGVDPIRSRLTRLEAIASARKQDEKGAIAELNDLMTNPTISGLRMVMLRDKADKSLRKYYIRESPREVAATARIQFEYLSDFELNKKNLSLSKSKDSVDKYELVTTSPPYDTIAPQSKLAKEILDVVHTRMSQIGWDSAFAGFIEKILKEPDLDPILKLTLFKRVGQIAGKRSLLLQEALQQPLTIVDAGNLTLTVNWLNPDDAEARAERNNRVREVIERMPDLSKLNDTIETKLLELGGIPVDQYEWYGWLKQDDQVKDRWSCETRKIASPLTGDLFVVYKTTGKTEATLTKIGTLNAGVATIQTANSSTHVEGRPIFVLKATAK